MAETCCGKIRQREFDVHEVPPPCRLVVDLGRDAIAVPILVRPRRLARDLVVGKGISIGREEPRHLGAGRGVEIVLGDERDDLVTFVSPSPRGMRARQRDAEKNAREEKTLRGLPP
jgi:hypothetical protein